MMGIFDFFRANGADSPEKITAQIQRLSDRASDKRAQPYDRQEAIYALVGMKSVEAASALLRRLTFSCEPSITDLEEKDTVFAAVVDVGPAILPALRLVVRKADTLGWPLRIARAVLDEDVYVQEILAWLEPWDTEYSKFIDPKLQVLAALADVTNQAIPSAIERFLDDVNEEARFNTVAALFMQNTDSPPLPLLRVLARDESVRIRSRIAEELVAKRWPIPEDERGRVRKGLPSGFVIDGEGIMAKRASLELPWL